MNVEVYIVELLAVICLSTFLMFICGILNQVLVLLLVVCCY